MQLPITSNAIKYFNSYEQREDAFNSKVGALIPRKYAGPSAFWQDFREIRHRELGLSADPGVAHVSSNPRDCLAFANPWQVLQAAAMVTAGSGDRARRAVASAVDQFDLAANLYQPIRTLSGGETVKVALAKCWLAAGGVRGLIVANPFSWLSRKNVCYLDTTVDEYSRRGLPVELMALNGEDSPKPIDAANFARKIDAGSVPFELALESVRIPLGAPVAAFDSQPVWARIENRSLSLKSPCLLVGENGQGKSLVAKALSGAISHEGSMDINAGGRVEAARLIFQDVPVQTLLRPFDRLGGLLPGARRERAGELFREITALMRELDPRVGLPPTDQTDRNNNRNLLEIKGMLAASRLGETPGMLILDEPDWGLTRRDSAAWVVSVVNAAHRLGIPVVVISHKPWWVPLVESMVGVTRETADPRAGDAEAFCIRLDPKEKR